MGDETPSSEVVETIRQILFHSEYYEAAVVDLRVQIDNGALYNGTIQYVTTKSTEESIRGWIGFGDHYKLTVDPAVGVVKLIDTNQKVFLDNVVRVDTRVETPGAGGYE